MKHLALILQLLVAFAGSSRAWADARLEEEPGYLAIDKAIDLTVVKPTVNVNLPRFLLKETLAEFNGGPDDPLAKAGINLGEILRDVKLIRVLVFEGKAAKNASLTNAIAELRRTLDARWTTIASVPQDHVSIHAQSDAKGESVVGLAVVVNDGDTVIVNIVGQVSIGKLVKLAANSGKFPKDVLKKLMEGGQGEAPAAKPAAATTTSEPAAK